MAALVSATVLPSCSSAKPPDLLPTKAAASPGGAQTYSPAGLDASMMLPSSWKAVPLTEGAQFAMSSAAKPRQFMIAGRYGSFLPISLTHLEAGRIKFLQNHGAKIMSKVAGSIDGHPAARLTYLIGAATTEVADTEYDVIIRSPLAVGANQHQTVYSDVEIVLGTARSAAGQATPVFDWIASTIKIQ